MSGIHLSAESWLLVLLDGPVWIVELVASESSGNVSTESRG